jgi:hypothetical protein
VIRKRPVGLSVLPEDGGASRTGRAALPSDIDERSALDHPHIARVRDSNGQQYSASGEPLDGEFLREVLTHLLPERLGAAEADDIVRAIGSALVYAHGQGIVHGDVCPENVLVTMDRRFMLTNFPARRDASVAGRARRPSDDVVGLARLAAELYTGSSSPHALRAAAHGDVPAARLNAIRAVLEDTSRRRSASIAEFLTTAGLSLPGRAAATARRAPRQERSPSFWRYALPVAALIIIGTLVALYYAPEGAQRESVSELQRRALDALRAPATPVNPPAPAEGTDAEAIDAGAARNDAANTALAGAPVETRANAAPSTVETVAEPAVEPLPATQPTTTVPPTAPSSNAATAAVPDPTVLSMSVPRIAVREDHTVVVIDIIRSGDTTREMSVGWWVTPGTAEPDEDYATGGKQVVSFPAGSTAQRVLIPIIDDRTREPEEVFTVHLSPPRNGVLGEVAATRVTVYDDD